MASFLRDRRGAVTIQVVLLLPVLIVIIMGAYEVWKVLYVQQTMNDAAYQGVRLLAMQPGYSDANVQAENLVRRYVSQNSVVDIPPASPALEVHVIVPYPPQTGQTVSIEVLMDWTVGEEWGVHAWAPFLGLQRRLRAYAEGEVLGGQQVLN
jgi:hypothetical protein